tara:strand:- start:188 stop:910 length:723 start_codon:yes stop_codon:yes gene_type:complete
MAEDTKIQWTDNTWNPWRGCSKVSPGCKNCYMFSDQKRYGMDPTLVTRTKSGTFNKPLSWSKNLQAGESLRVFTCSWSDWFHPEADEWRDDAWAIVRKTPNIIYQILTKRPHLISNRLPSDWGEGYENVWLGISAEDQNHFDERWPLLDNTYAKVKFVSYEPALGPLSVAAHLSSKEWSGVPDWIIAGGESGSGARSFDPAWASTLVEESRSLGFKLFVKQMGVFSSHEQGYSVARRDRV